MNNIEKTIDNYIEKQVNSSISKQAGDLGIDIGDFGKQNTLEKRKELYLVDEKNIVDELKMQRLELKLTILSPGFEEFKKELKTLKEETKKTNKSVVINKNIHAIVGGTAEFDIKKFDKGLVNSVIGDLKKQGITNLFVIKAILCTIAKESRFNPSISEINYNKTSNKRIRETFGSRVSSLSEEELTILKNNPKDFWDRVYGPDDPTGMSQKYGNTNKGDGMRYRGRGLNGITFKSNYRKYGNMIGEDLVSHPEFLGNKAIASKVNAAYYITQFKKKYTQKKYNYKDLNKVDNFDTALDIAINVTAGIGKDINSKNLQYNRDKALQNAQNFEFKNVA